MSKKEEVRVRIAPSPTGKLHVGTARTALFNYLFAKHEEGKFILRIEDTDLSRSTKEYEKNITVGLKWLGLIFDEGPFYQMRRLNLYQKYIKKLRESGHIYECYCTPQELQEERKEQLARGLPPKYSGKCKHLKKGASKTSQKPALRLDVASVVKKYNLPRFLEFQDLIRGKIKKDVSEISDFILMKNNGIPLFFFAGVIDDQEMRINYVIRGEDHISNTFNQLLLIKALGFNIPKYAHLPLILSQDQRKLSKRHSDKVAIDDFKRMGYLPEAMVNFLALLGWRPKEKSKIKNQKTELKRTEIYSLKELVDRFSLDDVGKSAAIFDLNKLNYLNGYYIRKKSSKELVELIRPKNSEPDPEKIVTVIKDRLEKLADFDKLTKYFYKIPQYRPDLLIFKKSNKEKTKKGLKTALGELENTRAKAWQNIDELNEILAQLPKKSKLTNGDVFWPIRVALSGKEASPSPAELLWVFGKNKSLKRLRLALNKLSSLT